MEKSKRISVETDNETQALKHIFTRLISLDLAEEELEWRRDDDQKIVVFFFWGERKEKKNE